jgi:acetyltransferase-like isoleucine patch superfamily enzyme
MDVIKWNYKLRWGFRALIYKLFFGGLKLPGYIGRPVFLLGCKRAFFASRVRIFPDMRLEVHGKGRLNICEDVSIGQGFHVICAGDLEIGRGTVISAFVMITDMDHEYLDIHKSVAQQPLINRKTAIGENCFIGMGARIQAGTILGRHCVVGTNAVVRGVYPDYSVIVGSPGKVVKKYIPEKRMWERC